MLVDLFKSKQIKGKSQTRGKDTQAARTNMNKGRLRAYLSKRYKGPVAEKIINGIGMTVPLEFEEYIEMIEKLLNYTPEKLMRMAFNVFDFNEDK